MIRNTWVKPTVEWFILNHEEIASDDVLKIDLDVCDEVGEIVDLETNDIVYPVGHPEQSYWVLAYVDEQMVKVQDKKSRDTLMVPANILVRESLDLINFSFDLNIVASPITR